MLPGQLKKFHQARLISLCIAFTSLLTPTSEVAAEESFCDNLPRAAYSTLTKHSMSNDWFEVYEVEAGIFAIYEPFQWEEVLSYLIVGTEAALLFDTGNGMDDIKAIVDQLTEKPLKVLNSHSHYDHIGGNHQFPEVMSPSTEFSHTNSKGRADDYVKFEASPDALCKAIPNGNTQETHHIKPYDITEAVSDGQVIDLGGRRLEVIFIPGHTDDSIALLDRSAGLLWTGDSFYVGPIFLESPETDLKAYKASLDKMVSLVPTLKHILPAHNTTMVAPSVLVDVQKAYETVADGNAKAAATSPFPGTVSFEFGDFGFVFRENYLPSAEN